MEEKKATEKEVYVKVLNPEKVLEFKRNSSSDMDEAEIIIENISQENSISKIYINNYSHFKCTPNIVMINKNSSKKIKVVVDDKNYKVSNSDVFLIISHPVKEQVDDANLNTFFKNNSSFKENGQKLFLIGYKKEKKIDNESKDDKLINKIKELEKQVFEKSEEEINDKNEDSKIKEKEGEVKPPSIKKNSNNYYILGGILLLVGSILLYKLLKK
jgi:hypothetical protein